MDGAEFPTALAAREGAVVKRATLAGILGVVLGAVGAWYGVPRPVTEKIVQVLVPTAPPVVGTLDANGDLQCPSGASECAFPVPAPPPAPPVDLWKEGSGFPKSETWGWGPMQPQTLTCAREGWAVDVPSGRRRTFPPTADVQPERKLGALTSGDLAYYRALHRAGLVPVTEHRPR